MDLLEEIRKRGSMVDGSIQNLMPIGEPDELYRAMRYLFDAGGKRLRPAALILSTEAVGGNPKDVIPAATAVELVHNFTLIHDDIMDQDSLRRGIPAVHIKWGLSGAILAGDTLYSKSFHILSQTRADAARMVECLTLMSITCTEICEGQWTDISFEKRNDVSEAEYMDMVTKKTAILYAASCKMGAILGGGTPEQAQALWDFGRLTGVGFQIFDDVLDLVTPEDVLGKIRGSDIMEGKQTLIAIHARDHNVKLDVFGKRDATREEIDDALEKLKESGSIDYVQDKALNFVAEGKEKLDILPESEAKDIMLALADYMIERKF
ncbi:MAG: polyprenyl synthetase family protein [Methanosarcinales archaeon]|nr:polyprenyl synthetase family protein [ANME-2 cluster archaeon]MDW7775497.1 polyprenyl synthetase family protein [Methanosarcinales archaeon]